MSEVWQYSAWNTLSLLRRGELNSLELLDEIESRCRAINPAINALPTLCFERARECAHQLERCRNTQPTRLHGLPVTIKDLLEVSGVRTTYGSTLYRDYIPTRSDRLVQHIESQGGIVYAKSNTPEFGAGGITFNSVFGPTLNPRNTTYAAGGSSGGAAASLASGCAWLSHGSDMAGSLRTPAAFCGVTSLRPSPGRIRADAPLLPFDSLSQEGPMAREIADLALFAEALFDQPCPDWDDHSLLAIQPERVAYSEDLGVTRIDDEILSALEHFVRILTRNGCHVVTDQPPLEGVHDTFDVLRAHTYAISLEGTLAEYPGTMKPEIEWNIRKGIDLSSEQIRQAQRQQGRIVASAARFMQDFDLFICPATSTTAVLANNRYPGFEADIPVQEYYRWLAIAYAPTLMALPIVTLPIGHSPQGMPIAVQLIGKPGADRRLLQLAYWIEQRIAWDPIPVDPFSP